MLKKSVLIDSLRVLRFAGPARLSLLVILTLLAVTSVAVSARAWLRRAEVHPSATPRLASTTSQDVWKGQRPSVAMLTVRPTGFEPAEISRGEGRFLLMVDNRSGFRDVVLQLEKETATGRRPVSLTDDPQVGTGKPRPVHVTHGSLDFRNILELQPGDYILSVINRPEWNCRIRITSR